jgi:chorismate mutase
MTTKLAVAPLVRSAATDPAAAPLARPTRRRHLRRVAAERPSPRARSVRAIRGATTVAADEPVFIREAVIELLEAMLSENDLTPGDLISAVFTATPDLVSEFPAHAARVIGWSDVPLLCAQELPVEGALPMCIRVMLHAETRRIRSEIKHAYLREAVLLRQDLLSD